MTALILALITIIGLSAALLFVVDAGVGAWERVSEIPEVATFGSDLVGQILGAAGCGLFVLTMAYLVGRYGPWVLVLSVLLTISVVEAVSLSGRPPHGLRRRVASRLGLWPRLQRRERPYLGWSRARTHRWRLAAGTPEDSIGVVGPPRVGKTMGLIVPLLLLWSGPAISTSTKPDVLRASAGWRLKLARRYGGDVYVYAPSADGAVEGLRPIRWSPLTDCTDPRVAKLRVDALVAAAQTGRGVEDPDHWRAGAARILRPYFLAAACHPRRSGDLGVVRRWLAAQEVAEPVSVLRGLQNAAGYQWAAELEDVANTPDRERGSFYSAAETTLAATSDPRVLDSCSSTELDIERFLLTRSTLYVVSQTEDQKAVAPLISALIESVVTTAYEFHRQRRLEARLLLSLDEFANIAPLPNVESIVSQGAGQGVNIVWAAQSLAQLRHRYGEHAAEAIWSATTAKLVFGGLADHQLLERVSNLVGDREVRTKSKTWVPKPDSATRGITQVTTSMTWRLRLSAADLRKLRPGWALLLYHHREPYCLRVPIAQHRRLFRRALLPWVARLAEPERLQLEVLDGEPAEGTEDVGA